MSCAVVPDEAHGDILHPRAVTDAIAFAAPTANDIKIPTGLILRQLFRRQPSLQQTDAPQFFLGATRLKAPVSNGACPSRGRRWPYAKRSAPRKVPTGASNMQPRVNTRSSLGICSWQSRKTSSPRKATRLSFQGTMGTGSARGFTHARASSRMSPREPNYLVASSRVGWRGQFA